MLASMQETYLYHETTFRPKWKSADGWVDFRYGRTAVSSLRNGEYRSFILFFFTILYHLLDCKMVSDRFWMIYDIAENPRPTDKCVKYTPAALGLRTLQSSTLWELEHESPKSCSPHFTSGMSPTGHWICSS